MNEIVPTTVLSKRALSATLGIGTGLLLFLVSALHPIVGILVGAIAVGLGLVSVRAEDPSDRRGGTLSILVGGAVLVFKILGFIPVLGKLAKTGFTLAALGLIGIGVYNGWQFWKGLKTRR